MWGESARTRRTTRPRRGRGRARGHPAVILSAYVTPSVACGTNSGEGRRGRRRAARRRPAPRRAKTAPASSSSPIGKACCAAIGPASSSFTVSWIVTPVSTVTRENRALHGRSTPPARQQRRMHVEPFPLREQVVGDQETVRAHDDDRCAEIETRLGSLRLQHRARRAARQRPSQEAARAVAHAPAAHRVGSAEPRSRGGPQAAPARPLRTAPLRRPRSGP